MLNENKYSTPSDVWAYGIVCWEIMTDGETPYGDCDNLVMVAERITNGSLLPQPSGCSMAVYTNMMIPCWKPDPKLRPSFAKLEHHAQSLGGVVTDRLAHDNTASTETPSYDPPHRPPTFLDEETAHYSQIVQGSYMLSSENPLFDHRHIYESNDDMLDRPSSDVDDDTPLL